MFLRTERAAVGLVARSPSFPLGRGRSKLQNTE